jgi:predicted TIM-barrel fold metal-dependent hydrolase
MIARRITTPSHEEQDRIGRRNAARLFNLRNNL